MRTERGQPAGRPTLPVIASSARSRSHLKRRYGLDRSRLKGHAGQQTWTAWAILAYNLDTLAVRAR
jgi:IS5 family transposase